MHNKTIAATLLALSVATSCFAADTGIYAIHAQALNGKDIALSQYKGKVLLVVNTASACGYTPQYAGLEKLYQKYQSQGLEILGFPCDQFGHQEPGNSTEIASFCKKNYGVNFQMFSKIDVNGDKAHPLYKLLKGSPRGGAGAEPIKWNFTKFLVSRNGDVVKRYDSKVDPMAISSDIEAQLAAK
jgi:glutathione peroxidase